MQGQEAPDCLQALVQAATLRSRCLREPAALREGTDSVFQVNGPLQRSPGLLRPVKWPAQQGRLHNATLCPWQCCS